MPFVFADESHLCDAICTGTSRLFQKVIHSKILANLPNFELSGRINTEEIGVSVVSNYPGIEIIGYIHISSD